MDQCNLADKVDANGCACVEIRKGMHGLIQAARIAYDRLVKLLAPHGCYPIRHSPGIWKRKTLPTTFAPCVDDFGIKHTDPQHAHHLINTLQKHYKISTDWEGTAYCGLHLQKKLGFLFYPRLYESTHLRLLGGTDSAFSNCT
jgi:hypothetical protein